MILMNLFLTYFQSVNGHQRQVVIRRWASSRLAGQKRENLPPKETRPASKKPDSKRSLNHQAMMKKKKTRKLRTENKEDEFKQFSSHQATALVMETSCKSFCHKNILPDLMQWPPFSASFTRGKQYGSRKEAARNASPTTKSQRSGMVTNYQSFCSFGQYQVQPMVRSHLTP